MSWKQDTLRALVGPQVWLRTSAPEGGSPTLWIRPKKWGMAAKEAIDAFRKQIISSKESRGNVRRFGELMKKCQADDEVAEEEEAEEEEEEADPDDEDAEEAVQAKKRARKNARRSLVEESD